MTTVRAAVLHESPGWLDISAITMDTPARHEVVVRTAAAGLCHSDLHYLEGKYIPKLPVVVGHESAGVVEAVGDGVTYVRPGDHVITCLSVFCGECSYCVTGRPHLCSSADVRRGPGMTPRLTEDGVALSAVGQLGSFAEAMLVHEHALVKIDPTMPLDRAALLGCGTITGVGAVFTTAKVPPGSTVAAVDAVIELTRGGVEYSFEAIGLSATAEQSFAMLARGGTATVIGLISEGENVSIPGSALWMGEKRIQGSTMGSNRFRHDIPRLVDMYLQRRLNLDDLVSARISLDQVNDGFRALQSGEVARSVIVFDS